MTCGECKFFSRLPEAPFLGECKNKKSIHYGSLGHQTYKGCEDGKRFEDLQSRPAED